MLMLLTSLDTQSKPLHAAYSSPNSNMQRNKSLPFHRSIIPEKQLTILLLSLPKKITLNYIYWRNSLWKTSFFAWYLISITGKNFTTCTICSKVSGLKLTENNGYFV